MSKELFLKLDCVEGVVTPVSWDKKGGIKSFSIFTPEDEDILIDGRRYFKLLQKLKGKNVKAMGHLSSTQWGAKILSPKKIFKIGKVENEAHESSFFEEEFKICGLDSA